MPWQEIDDQICNPATFAHETFHAHFRELRRKDPVHWTQGAGVPRPFWSITTHADCIEVLEDQARFSSRLGGVMPLTADEPSAEEQYALGFDAIPTFLDPPRHQKMRQPFNKHFAMPAIARLRSSVEAAAEAIIDEVVPRGACDFVNDIAGPLPAYVVCEMMGVPVEDRPRIRHHCAAFMGAQDPAFQIDGDELATQRHHLAAINRYMADLALSRRKASGDDFSSLVANMTVDGKPLSERDVGWWCFALVTAGLETTRSALAVGFLELLRNRDQMDILRADASLAPVAAEEFVRFTSPGRQKFRVAACDVDLRGKRIRKGDWVGCWISSANRDEAVFGDPDRLLVSRSPNPHIGFGAGGHSCLGRHLARLEMQVMTNALLRRLPSLELDGDYAWVESINASGLKAMPVRYAI